MKKVCLLSQGVFAKIRKAGHLSLFERTSACLIRGVVTSFRSFTCVTTPNSTRGKRKRIKWAAVATCCSRNDGSRCSLFLRARIVPAWRRDVTQKEDCVSRCRSPSTARECVSTRLTEAAMCVYILWRSSHLCVCGWVGGCVCVA